MIVVLADEQLERIEDALVASDGLIDEDEGEGYAVKTEIRDALAVVQAARALLAA